MRASPDDGAASAIAYAELAVHGHDSETLSRTPRPLIANLLRRRLVAPTLEDLVARSARRDE